MVSHAANCPVLTAESTDHLGRGVVDHRPVPVTAARVLCRGFEEQGARLAIERQVPLELGVKGGRKKLYEYVLVVTSSVVATSSVSTASTVPSSTISVRPVVFGARNERKTPLSDHPLVVGLNLGLREGTHSVPARGVE